MKLINKPGFQLYLEFVPQDFWIGLYWKKERYQGVSFDYYITRYYLCILPMLPIVFVFAKETKNNPPKTQFL